MKIHEYQAKGILAKYGVPGPRGEVANTLDQAVEIGKRLFAGGATGVVVKAQIHAGGLRARAARVKVAKEHRPQAEEYATEHPGHAADHSLRPARRDRRCSGCLSRRRPRSIASCIWALCSIGPRRSWSSWHRKPAAWRSKRSRRVKTSDAIVKAYIDPAIGFQAYQARKLAFALGLKPTQINDAVKFMQGLYKAFIETDSSLLEINPFITTKDDKLFALDCKINFDDNATFRHKELKELRDVAEEDPLEVEASKYALNYIKLDGNIACMVNGAGLAMATMDIIQYAGGSPANFLDVGGGANQQQIEQAFAILLSDKNVKAIFINIFGGILRVDVLANGVAQAAKNLAVKVPIVLRLEGTNVEEGRKILKDSGLNFLVGETMQDAAEKVVAAAKGSN